MEHCIEITRVTHSAYAVDYQGERIGQGRSRHSAPGRTQDSKKMTAVMAAFSKQATMSDTTRLSHSRMRFSYVISRFFHLHRRDLQQR
jgi:hypothetical protein